MPSTPVLDFRSLDLYPSAAMRVICKQLRQTNSQAGLLEMQQPDYMNGNSNAGPSHSPNIHNNKTHATHHNDSPPAIQEAVMIKQEAISDMPGMTGIFEREPQLGVDFILA